MVSSAARRITTVFDLWPLPPPERTGPRSRQGPGVYRSWPPFAGGGEHFVTWTPASMGWVKLVCRCGLRWVGAADEATAADLVVRHLQWRDPA